MCEVPTVDRFYADYHELLSFSHDASSNGLAYRRLQLLEAKFDLHALLNRGRELAAQQSVPHRDFYNVRKVDTHVHHSACMNLKHLLRFIKVRPDPPRLPSCRP